MDSKINKLDNWSSISSHSFPCADKNSNGLMGIIRSISHLSPCSGIQTSRMRVKRAFVADNLMTSVLLVFEIVEYDNIGWPCIVDELLLCTFSLHSKTGACDNYLSDLTRGAPGYPVASNQDLSKKGLGSGRRSWPSRGALVVSANIPRSLRLTSGGRGAC